MKLREGIGNSIFSDQMIECTYMKSGKEPEGLKCVTLKPEALKRWAFSIHVCGSVDNRETFCGRVKHHM